MAYLSVLCPQPRRSFFFTVNNSNISKVNLALVLKWLLTDTEVLGSIPHGTGVIFFFIEKNFFLPCH